MTYPSGYLMFTFSEHSFTLTPMLTESNAENIYLRNERIPVLIKKNLFLKIF